MYQFETILFTVESGIAVVTLNRQEALNALNLHMMGDIKSAMDIVESDRNIKALVITGAGRAFCSGQDLRNRPPQSTDIVTALMEGYFPTLHAVKNSSVPVVTAVNGVAAGAGCAFALLGDLTIAGESASFIQVFSRIGLAPDLGSTYLLPRLIGRSRALRMMLTNESISAREALQWGMISACVDDKKLIETAVGRAQLLTA
ncbi:enoyl-CoA hydratase-related protein [bacterium]|nr:enoyl-CoA hydratase-related protein [bacterium]